MAALEAMAAGVPVVSSNAGGIPEVNLNGITGYTLPVGDVNGMAEKSIHILKNDKTLNEFKVNAKKQSEHFSLENILPQYENLYCEVSQKESPCLDEGI